MSEYYFDYQITPLSDPFQVFGNEKNLPRLYIERDYYNEKVKYVLYMVIPQWDATGQKKVRRTAPFDTVTLSYDVRGINTEIFDTKDTIEIKNQRITRNNSDCDNNYEKNGFRLPFDLEDETDYSGVGKMILSNSNDTAQEQSVLYFAVNFAFKKKIRYSINKDWLTIDCHDVRDSIKLRLCYLARRYPCLKGDRTTNQVKEIELSPGKDKKMKVALDIPGDNLCYYLAFSPEETKAEKYYLLECTENTSLPIQKHDFKRPEQQYFCPYCHGAINMNGALQKGYKKGGIACNGAHLQNDDKPLVILGNKKSRSKPAQNILYCGDDFDCVPEKSKSARDFNANTAAFARVLPENFLLHNHFKVVVVGSKRAGKTTFISRMFDITGAGENLELVSKMMRNATQGLCSLLPYTIKKLDIGTDGWRFGNNSWYKNEFYGRYSIDVKGEYPKATDKVSEDVREKKKMIAKYPFIYEVDGRDYVYFYDFAGEDAEHSGNRLTDVMTNAPLGIFYLIDGRGNELGNDSVLNRINETIRANDIRCPIAVVLTKFDMLEDEFDSNCHCLRSDVFDMVDDKFDGSVLEEHIDLASEEIRSYLVKKNINPKFEGDVNVRYFGVSSFSASDAVFHRDQEEGSAEVNYLKHSCSAKRMELPLLWMLRQFGSIV